MNHYKVVYNIEGYKTPHSRYYTAKTESVARDMFAETCEESLAGHNATIIEVVQVDQQTDQCCTDKCDCS